MEKFINELYNQIKKIIDCIQQNKIDYNTIQNNYNIDMNCFEFIKSKGTYFFSIYFDLAKEKKINFKYFIETELSDYYKNYNKKDYDKFKSFQKFQLDKLAEYELKLNKNKNFREIKQSEYINEINNLLIKDLKVFIKAPTGFGKTVLYYKTINKLKLKKVLIFTPRIELNKQIVEEKYFNYLGENKYKIIHYSDYYSGDKDKKIKRIKKYSKADTNFIMTSCYQSKDKLLKLINDYEVKFDLIIFDEAHTIETWSNIENTGHEFLLSDKITKYRLFGSATPTEFIETTPNIFGKVIEKVKIYELINNETLCNIVTLVKKIENKKKEYHNLKAMIVDCMKKFNKKKGIIYVNSKANAQSLYDLMKTQNNISTYIFVSGHVDIGSDSFDDLDIKKFESDTKPSIIIVVGKISYGYDNPYIDFICLGDPRQSDIDIRQILGRGLRWNKELYPNKLLHLLVPLYQDEFGNYTQNGCLKKYLDYIIGECGHDIIVKDKYDKPEIIREENPLVILGNDYDGYTIPIDILQSYCTTGYNKFTDFMRFMRINKCWDELVYNQIWENNKIWMCGIGELKKKYPKFSFQQIHPDKDSFYQTKIEALEAHSKAKEIVKKNIGSDIFSELIFSQQTKKIIKIDNKIPPINLELYY